MKNIFAIVLLSAMIVSCTVSEPKNRPRQVYFFGFDFSPYSAKGFFFTPEKYTSEYDPIGLITCAIFPEQKKIILNPEQKNDSISTPKRIDDIYYDGENDISRVILNTEVIKPEEILQIIYDECIKMGADAFVNFKFNPVNVHYGETVSVYIAEGFAIKRL